MGGPLSALTGDKLTLGSEQATATHGTSAPR